MKRLYRSYKVYNNKGLLKEMEGLLRYKSGNILMTLNNFKDSEEAQKSIKSCFSSGNY